MPLENSYLFHGHRYRDFSDSWFWKHYQPMFESVGLPLYQPVAGCSEIINMGIVREAGWEGWAQSCLRSAKVGRLRSVLEMFRKNSMLGLPFSMSNEIITFLGKEPIKQAASTLYSIQRGGVSSTEKTSAANFQIQSLLDMDFSFLDHHYAPALKLLPEKYQHFTTARLKGYVEKMTSPEVAQ